MFKKKLLTKIGTIIEYYYIIASEKIRIIFDFWKKPDFFLIGTPLHGNLGDHAIAIAEKSWIYKNFGNVTCVEITGTTYSKNMKLCKKLINKQINAVILISGGGFLGTLWPEEENRVLDIIDTFSHHKIIILPQTLYYDVESKEGGEFYRKAYKTYKMHKNLLLTVREKYSSDFMDRFFAQIKHFFVPDMVTFMSVPHYKIKRKGILFCLRKDKEKTVDSIEMELLEKRVGERWPDEEIVYTDTVLNKYISTKARNRAVEKKMIQFASSKLVITDRLHGMLFAAITGTPCIVLESKSWKVKGVYEYIAQNQYIQYVDRLEDIEYILYRIDLEKEYLYQNEDLVKYFDYLSKRVREYYNS